MIRQVGSLASVLLVTLGPALAAPSAEPWQAAEIVAFRDFDDLDVKLDGTPTRAFLVGLRPLRETIQDKPARKRGRQTILAELKKSQLFAQVITRKDKTPGLSLDAFAHKKNGFKHPWNPERYPYCWTGWGAYNFNTYFLYTKAAAVQDNFGDNKKWKGHFQEAMKKLPDVGALPPVPDAHRAWQEGTVVRLAQTIYQERAWDRLPILGDALDEAGCTSQVVLAHYHSGSLHVRGCWLLDWLLDLR